MVVVMFPNHQLEDLIPSSLRREMLFLLERLIIPKGRQYIYRVIWFCIINHGSQASSQRVDIKCILIAVLMATDNNDLLP